MATIFKSTNVVPEQRRSFLCNEHVLRQTTSSVQIVLNPSIIQIVVGHALFFLFSSFCRTPFFVSPQETKCQIIYLSFFLRVRSILMMNFRETCLMSNCRGSEFLSDRRSPRHPPQLEKTLKLQFIIQRKGDNS